MCLYNTNLWVVLKNRVGSLKTYVTYLTYAVVKNKPAIISFKHQMH